MVFIVWRAEESVRTMISYQSNVSRLRAQTSLERERKTLCFNRTGGTWCEMSLYGASHEFSVLPCNLLPL